MNDQEYEALSQLASAWDISISETVRRAVREAWQKVEAGH